MASFLKASTRDAGKATCTQSWCTPLSPGLRRSRWLAAKRRAAAWRSRQNRPALSGSHPLALPVQTRLQGHGLLNGHHLRLSLEPEVEDGGPAGILGLIAEVQQDRPQAGGGERPDGAETALEGGETDGMEGPRLGDREYPEGGLGKNAETPLAADEQVVEVDPGGALGDAAGTAYLSLGQHRFHPQHLVPHGAVFSAAVAEAVGGDGPAHGRHRQRPGIVAQHEPGPLQLGVEGLQHRAGLDPDRERVRVDVQDGVHPPEVHDDTGGQRDRRPHEPGTAAVGDQRHPVPVRHLHDGLHLDGGGRCADAQGLNGNDGMRRMDAAVAQRIPGMQIQLIGIRVDGCGAQPRGKPLDGVGVYARNSSKLHGSGPRPL